MRCLKRRKVGRLFNGDEIWLNYMSLIFYTCIILRRRPGEQFIRDRQENVSSRERMEIDKN